MSKPILLFDARNILYRAVYACGEEPQIVTVAMKLMAEGVAKFKPKMACVFWDSSNRAGWRRKVFPTYKERADQGDAREKVAAAEPLMAKLIPVVGLRQFLKEDAEADDLIYSACQILYPQEIVIVSSDKDYSQIVYRYPTTVRLYDHRSHSFFDRDNLDYDPVIQKSLAGDDSDEIPGYDQIGPVRSKKLAQSLGDLNAFLDERGAATYIRNRLLIDLSMCPNLLKNTLYVQKELTKKVEFSRAAVYDQAKKIPRLAEEYDRSIAPFKMLCEVTDG